ncbi:MAG TPA: DinB family protein [Pyrinomonadaceae bacterium]|nr:DinB family protein [Pyrinomonadaceae bacterium]
MLEQLVESWQINHRATLKLLGALSDEALHATLSARGGRDVARQLAHVHEVRLTWAEMTSKTNRNGKLPHFGKGEAPNKKDLKKALDSSAKAIERTTLSKSNQHARFANRGPTAERLPALSADSFRWSAISSRMNRIIAAVFF